MQIVNQNICKDLQLLHLPLAELVSRADRIRRDSAGERFELCSIINAKSGLCAEDCRFCAQSSRHKTGTPTYPLKTVDEIVKAAGVAKNIGAEKFGIVTSGNRMTAVELEDIARAVSAIRQEIGITVCASLGTLDKDTLIRLKKAGLSRYHHNIETSPRFYPSVVSTHSFRERIKTVKAAKKAGLEVCSGGIIGMGETWEDRLNMAYVLKDLGVDSIPLNFLVPIKGTPFENIKPISCNDAVKTISIFRIVLGGRMIKIAAGREAVLRDFQGLGFLAGANGMLIGGYLTIRGRDVARDKELVREVKRIWKA